MVLKEQDSLLFLTKGKILTFFFSIWTKRDKILLFFGNKKHVKNLWWIQSEINSLIINQLNYQLLKKQLTSYAAIET